MIFCACADFVAAVAIGAFHVFRVMRDGQPNARMAQSPLTAITGDFPLIDDLGFGCRNGHHLAYLVVAGLRPL